MNVVCKYLCSTALGWNREDVMGDVSFPSAKVATWSATAAAVTSGFFGLAVLSSPSERLENYLNRSYRFHPWTASRLSDWGVVFGPRYVRRFAREEAVSQDFVKDVLRFVDSPLGKMGRGFLALGGLCLVVAAAVGTYSFFTNRI